MLSFLKQLFYTNNKEHNNQSSKNKTENKSPCSLCIEMNFDGTINIVCSWPEFNDNNKKHLNYLANYYAIMIDALNSGFLNKEILKTIQNHESHNSMDTLFAQNVYYKIAELNFLKKEQEKSFSAIIKPSQVFNKSN